MEVFQSITAQKYFINHISSFWQVISFTRGPFLFVFNFNPEVSYELHSVGVDEAGEYQVSYA
jgi:1,4-alpha-glucan branching enzyme